ncbi:sensor histidine kinase [Eleftheria terrae]|uniref:sensor histidine kinase n=1 Tax=Eleftheria terrae TaxID=1597781 RepID=UPI00263BD439|nr:sensor histidine kinase [Eleftheria terrae]WKB55571.1 sensor histidine kinase [Eleftheria terrae]
MAWLAADDRPGLPVEARERVSDRFYRGVQGRGQAGSGLGLAIVQRAVARVGGGWCLPTGLEGASCCGALDMPAAR